MAGMMIVFGEIQRDVCVRRLLVVLGLKVEELMLSGE